LSVAGGAMSPVDLVYPDTGRLEIVTDTLLILLGSARTLHRAGEVQSPDRCDEDGSIALASQLVSQNFSE
jgi:hypothetical protein